MFLGSSGQNSPQSAHISNDFKKRCLKEIQLLKQHLTHVEHARCLMFAMMVAQCLAASIVGYVLLSQLLGKYVTNEPWQGYVIGFPLLQAWEIFISSVVISPLLLAEYGLAIGAMYLANPDFALLVHGHLPVKYDEALRGLKVWQGKQQPSTHSDSELKRGKELEFVEQLEVFIGQQTNLSESNLSESNYPTDAMSAVLYGTEPEARPLLSNV
ncbi:MAG: hypothetical protein CMF50_01120 [Legionellales bacterium]|nr:hypothetical protein [Legionellales bacterium]|tara:strand:+ start:1501 stop:2139 length:639 start_codon:yes stop_codon:yes gene_type:complete